MPSHFDWAKQVWDNPLPHDFVFGFGLDIDPASPLKAATIVPYCLQDNAIVDYETLKTNPQNADFAIMDKPNCAAGSYVGKIMVTWKAWAASSEIDLMNFNTLDIHTSMLNRLDAFDKKTGTDIEGLLELTHETTDEQCFPLWDGTKLYEGHLINDYAAEVPGLTTNQQPEGVAFNQEAFFDALHYYTNKEMLRKVTGRFKTWYINGSLPVAVPTRDKLVTSFGNKQQSLTKYMHPYSFVGELFSAPKASARNQMMLGTDVTAIEHLTVQGRVRFNEHNPDFNFARA